MTAREYKAMCAQPDVMSGDIIRQSARLVQQDPGLKERLMAILAQPPLQTPPQHNACHGSDLFEVDLSVDDASEIASYLFSAEADSVLPDGDAGPLTANYADLVDIWTRYEQFKEAEMQGERV
jgi:hypothetical protein